MNRVRTYSWPAIAALFGSYIEHLHRVHMLSTRGTVYLFVLFIAFGAVGVLPKGRRPSSKAETDS